MCPGALPLDSCLHPVQPLDEVHPTEVPEEASCQCIAACRVLHCATPHRLPCLQLSGLLQRAGQTGAHARQCCPAGRPWAVAGTPWAGACLCWLRQPAWRPAQMLPCGGDRLLQEKPLCPLAAPLPHDFPETLHSVQHRHTLFSHPYLLRPLITDPYVHPQCWNHACIACSTHGRTLASLQSWCSWHVSGAAHLLAGQTAALRPAPGPSWCRCWSAAPHHRRPGPPERCEHDAQTARWAGSRRQSPGAPQNHRSDAAWQALNRPASSPLSPHSKAQPDRAPSRGFTHLSHRDHYIFLAYDQHRP